MFSINAATVMALDELPSEASSTPNLGSNRDRLEDALDLKNPGADSF